MRPTVRLGRIAGIPLAAHWTALVVPALIADALGAAILPGTVKGAGQVAYWTTAAAVAVAFLLSLTAHELAHAVTARRQGLPVTGITLWMLGGVTQIDEAPKTPHADLLIAVVGPLTSLGCGVAAALGSAAVYVVGGPRVAVAGLIWLAAANALLAVFNMLPAAPLDGGRVLRAVVWRRTGDRHRAEQVATRSGRVTGLALAAVGGLQVMLTGDLVGGIWLMLIGWFLMSSAAAEAGAAETEEALGQVHVRDVMDRRFVALPAYQAAHVAARRAVDADADHCPVVDFDGRVVGVVDVNDLVRAARLPSPPPVSTVTRMLEPDMTTTPDELLVEALHRGGRHLPMVVLDGAEVVGLVTTMTVAHALRRGLLIAEPAT